MFLKPCISHFSHQFLNFKFCMLIVNPLCSRYKMCQALLMYKPQSRKSLQLSCIMSQIGLKHAIHLQNGTMNYLQVPPGEKLVEIRHYCLTCDCKIIESTYFELKEISSKDFLLMSSKNCFKSLAKEGHERTTGMSYSPAQTTF